MWGRKKMDHIILVSNEDQIGYLSRYKRIDEKPAIITLHNHLKERCQNQRFSNDYEIFSYSEVVSSYKSWEECLKEAKEFFDGWNNIKIDGKEVFTEVLGYNKVSVLDIDSVRYLSGHTEIIANLLFKIAVIQSIIKELKPKFVTMLYPKTDWERIMRLVCYKENVEMADHRRWLGNLKLYFEKRFLESRIKFFDKEFKAKIPFIILPFAARLKSRWGLFRGRVSKKSRMVDKRAILVFMINRKFSDVVIPVVESIEKDGIFKPLVLVPARFDASEILKERNIPFECIDSYLIGEIVRESNRIYSGVIKSWNKLKKQKEFKEKMYRYQDYNLEDFLSKEVEKTILLSVSSIKNILLIKRIIELHSAKVLFMPHLSENIVKSSTAGCKEAGIPTIGLHRGTAGETSEYGSFIGDRLLVAGKHAKEVFSHWGIKEDKIRITGLPIFDDLLIKLKDKNTIEKSIRNSLNIDPKFHIITYLTQSRSGRFGHQERLNEIRIIYNVVKGLDDVFLIIKIHPTESDTEVYGKIAEEIELERYAITRNELPLDDLLLSSKIAITKNSTTGFNALIAGCKLIVVGFHNKNFSDSFFVDSGVALTATSSEELYTNIRTALINDEEDLIQSSKVNEFLENHFYKLDGKSTEMIKHNIYELIEDTIKL